MNKVREIRRALDITQDELARRVETSSSYICDLEKGRVRAPSLGRARLIALHLNSTIDEVFPTEEQQ